jgi:hypothetical protein
MDLERAFYIFMDLLPYILMGLLGLALVVGVITFICSVIVARGSSGDSTEVGKVEEGLREKWFNQGYEEGLSDGVARNRSFGDSPMGVLLGLSAIILSIASLLLLLPWR